MNELAPIQSCWRQVGVWGDSSCPELPSYVHCRNCPRFSAAARQLLVRNAAGHEPGDADSAPPPPRGLVGVLVFRLADLVFGLDAAFTAELASNRPLRRIAHRSGRLLEGLVNIRGELQLCIALERLLGLQRQAEWTSSARMLVVRGQAEPWVFRVDAVLGMERYAPDQLEALPPALPTSLAPFLRGIAPLQRRSDMAVAGARRARPGANSWPDRVVLLDGAALLAGMESSVF